MKTLIILSSLAFSCLSYAAEPQGYPMDKISEVAIGAFKEKRKQALEQTDNLRIANIDISVYQVAPFLERSDLDIIVDPVGKRLATVSFILEPNYCTIQVGVDVETLAITIPASHNCY